MKERTRKKLIKSSAVVSYVGIGIATLGMFSLFSGLGVFSAAEKCVKENGYIEFNQQYKAERVADLTENYESGEITDKQYLDEISNMKDYDKDKYMQEYAEAEQLEKYNSLTKASDILDKTIYAVPAGMGTAFIGVIGLAVFETSLKKKENKNEIKEIEKS